MQIYEELKARGLIAQVTDEEEIRELVNNGKATFYIGFDPTADSLHVGHFITATALKSRWSVSLILEKGKPLWSTMPTGS